MPKEVESALTAWREAVIRREAADGETEALDAAVDRARNHFQSESVGHMSGRIEALHEAESRRASAIPSTEPFHQAAKDEKAIAVEIFQSARSYDEDSPQTRPGADGDLK